MTGFALSQFDTPTTRNYRVSVTANLNDRILAAKRAQTVSDRILSFISAAGDEIKLMSDSEAISQIKSLILSASMIHGAIGEVIKDAAKRAPGDDGDSLFSLHTKDDVDGILVRAEIFCGVVEGIFDLSE